MRLVPRNGQGGGRGCRFTGATLLCVALSLLAAGCGPPAEEEPRAPSGPFPGGSSRPLRVGAQALSDLDPHRATSTADIQVLEQVYEHLTAIDPRGRPVPELATAWESSDGRRWTFTLRKGARFSSGKPVTADDVVFSFRRLGAPEVGEIRALDPGRVQFLLKEPNVEFPVDVADYHAVVLPVGTQDPAGERAGSGPFAIAFYVPARALLLRRNPYYEVTDRAGSRLPYLEEIRFDFTADLERQVEALRDGELDFVGGLTGEMVRTLRRSRRVRLITIDANMHWLIHMRSDPGRPAADNRVRQALKLATRQQGLINAVRPGLGAVGNGFTPVGPAFGMYHLVRPPFEDTDRARKLLAEAGYREGLSITLTIPDHPEAEAIADAWGKQMARIGVEVGVRKLPAAGYYGPEAENWLNADFGLTDWGARPSALAYFKLSYLSGAPWNESHWSDPEFDGVVRRLQQEIDENERIVLYHRAQEILIARGPVIVAYFVKAAAGVSPALHGVTLAADWPRTRFRDAHFR
jgi:peptide/nickel transport system substrate-binding protein